MAFSQWLNKKKWSFYEKNLRNQSGFWQRPNPGTEYYYNIAEIFVFNTDNNVLVFFD